MNKLVSDTAQQILSNKTIDALSNSITNIGTAELANTYKSISIITALEINWEIAQGFTKELLANTTLSFSNLFVGAKDLVISGDFALILPTWVKIVEGEYTGEFTNHIQIICTNATPGQEEAWCSFGNIEIVQATDMFFDITDVTIPLTLQESNTANGTLTITNFGADEGTQPIDIAWYKDGLLQFQYVTLVTIAAGATAVHNISDYFGTSTEGIWHVLATSFNDYETSNKMDISSAPREAYVYFIRIDLPTPRTVGTLAQGQVRTMNIGDFPTTQDILVIWKRGTEIMYQHTISDQYYPANSYKYLPTSLQLLPQHIGTGWTIEAYSDDHSVISSPFEITEALLTPAYFRIDSISIPVNLNVNDIASSSIQITNTGEENDTQILTIIWKKDGIEMFSETENVSLTPNETTIFQSLLTLIEDHVGDGWTITVITENETLTSLPFEVFFAAVLCDGSTSYPGGISFPTIQEINLGTDTGDVTLYFNANSIPDKFIVVFDGVEVINTGYRGSVHLQDDLDAAILSYDPTYDKVNAQETIDPQSLGEITFAKNTITTKAYVYVYAPILGTGWDFTLFCPNQAK